MIRHFLSRQFLGFVGVGVTAALANWVSRWVFRHWTSYEVAVTLAYACGLGTGFVLNRLFVFPGGSRPVARQARDFILVNMAWFPVVFGASLLLADLFARMGVGDWSEGMAHAVATAVPAAATFLIYKFYTFR